MIVAIPKEINAIEPRVAATPSTVKDLIKSGLQVQVETLAGNESFFSDQEYINAGAEILGIGGLHYYSIKAQSSDSPIYTIDQVLPYQSYKKFIAHYLKTFL